MKGRGALFGAPVAGPGRGGASDCAVHDSRKEPVVRFFATMRFFALSIGLGRVLRGRRSADSGARFQQHGDGIEGTYSR